MLGGLQFAEQDISFLRPLFGVDACLFSNYTKMSSALLDIYCREGFRGLCCGLTPTLVRDAPYSGLYLMFYTQLKQIMSNEHVLKSNPTLATITHFTCGLTAGLLASLVTLNFNAKNYKNTKTIYLGYASRRCG